MAETGTCYLYFAAVTDDGAHEREAATNVGRELRDILRAHGLIVDWNEDPGVALLVRPVPK